MNKIPEVLIGVGFVLFCSLLALVAVTFFIVLGYLILSLF